MRVALLYDIIYDNVTDLFTVQWYCRGIKISIVRKRDLPFSLKTSCCMAFTFPHFIPTSKEECRIGRIQFSLYFLPNSIGFVFLMKQ